MSKKLILIVAAFALTISLAVGAFVLSRRIPPRAARLLPEADAAVFVDLRPLRQATHFDRDPTARSPEFQRFIDATGFIPERDLDSAAFALHRMTDPFGPNGPVAYSEIFIGRFDVIRLSKYLAAVATKQEHYGNQIIFDIPIEGRTLRVTQLLQDTIAASNAPTPEQIHAIIDRNRSGFALLQSSRLLAALYPAVPILSPAWALGRIGLPFNEHGRITLSGLELPISAQSDFVASLRYTGKLQLRLEQVATSPGDAQQAVDNLRTLLAVFRLVHAVPPIDQVDQPLLQLANSVQIEQSGARAVLTADLPDTLLHQLAESSRLSPRTR